MHLKVARAGVHRIDALLPRVMREDRHDRPFLNSSSQAESKKLLGTDEWLAGARADDLDRQSRYLSLSTICTCDCCAFSWELLTAF